jgi:hypothetical protein
MTLVTVGRVPSTRDGGVEKALQVEAILHTVTGNIERHLR